ncbi:MAG: TrbI/VirB10 family protein [Bacteriovoracia bacterium]
MKQKSKWSVDNFFLEEARPYTKKRKIKMKTVKWVSGVSLVVMILLILWKGETPKEPQPATASSVVTSPTTNAAAEYVQSQNEKGSFSRPAMQGSYSGGTLQRNRNAAQVISRSTQGLDLENSLPMGFGIVVRLINAIQSDSSSPVIAEITEDVYGKSNLLIPARTRAIGTASFRNGAQRLDLRFHTFVFPEGDQHAVQGIGMMPDGSAGLAGEYHSGEGLRQIGRFVGNFVGGFAHGMTEKTASGMSGTPYEIASLKNGVFMGMSQSAEDVSKQFAENMGQTKPYMTLNQGSRFILYLEKEFTP